MNDGEFVDSVWVIGDRKGCEVIISVNEGHQVRIALRDSLFPDDFDVSNAQSTRPETSRFMDARHTFYYCCAEAPTTTRKPSSTVMFTGDSVT